MPSTTDERIAFSQRLKLALKRSKKKIDTPTELALQFNLRHKNDSVTPAAAQKWITGKSLPTPDKIETIATWLNVSLQWLRYGIPEARPAKSTRAIASALTNVPPNESERALLQQIRNLPESRRQLVIEIVEQFAIEQSMWQN